MRVGVLYNPHTPPSQPTYAHNTQHHTRVVLVPGPWDVGYAGVLPQAPLLVPLVTALRDKVPNIVFASNPCRIRWCTQEIVVFRYDLQLEMLRQHILGGGHGMLGWCVGVLVGWVVGVLVHGCWWGVT